MNNDQEIERSRKVAEKLDALDLHVKTEEEMKEEIRLLRQDNEIKQVLVDYEKQYGMSTVDFFRKFIAGETDDRMDFIEWASLAQMIVG
ncbi:MAG TPA: hypothetical protein PLA27_07740 [Anaerolineales bacterium]|jgi:uncharacterized membrane protein|nr:hypothetical protein [Anaerolineales bacterium]